MIELTGNLWDYIGRAQFLCITTNGDTNYMGRAVMGRGVAREAKNRYPNLAKNLGTWLRMHGNHVRPIWTDQGTRIVTFPVKHHWWEPADPDLIVRSAGQLVALTNAEGITNVVLPRPGCGNGHLTWEVVGPLLAPILDGRFVIVNR